MPGGLGGADVPAEGPAMLVSCLGVSWNVTYRQRWPCSSAWAVQRSPKMVLPTPEGPVTRVASVACGPPSMSWSRPGIPVAIRPAAASIASGMRVSMRGKTSMPAR